MPAEKPKIKTSSVAREGSDLEPSPPNVQDTFLNQIRRDHVTVTLYLMNGIKLIGRVKSFDKFSVLLDAGQQDMLIFKHAISTVSVPRSATELRRSEASAAAKERPRARSDQAKQE